MDLRKPARRHLGLLLLTAAMVLSSCGSSKPAATTHSSPPAQPPHGAKASLSVTYWPHGQQEGGASRWSLTCAPPGGSHPRPSEACSELAAHASLLAPAKRPCVLAQSRGGGSALLLRRGTPEAIVAGSYGGRRIVRLVRPPCDPAAWAQLHVLLTGG